MKKIWEAELENPFLLWNRSTGLYWNFQLARLGWHRTDRSVAAAAKPQLLWISRGHLNQQQHKLIKALCYERCSWAPLMIAHRHASLAETGGAAMNLTCLWQAALTALMWGLTRAPAEESLICSNQTFKLQEVAISEEHRGTTAPLM